jgi:hypothetical protein
MKSIADLQRLFVIFRQPDFNIEEVKDLNVDQELKKMEKDPTFQAESGWKEATVLLPAPCPRTKISEERAYNIEVKGVYYRSLIHIMQDTCMGIHSNDLHLTPYKQFHDRLDGSTERVRSETYNSDAMYEEHVRLQAAHIAAGGEDEVVVFGKHVWSDSTHLAQFGSLANWPVYVYCGNITQYKRAKPSAHCVNHAAYIPSVLLVTFSAVSVY